MQCHWSIEHCVIQHEALVAMDEDDSERAMRRGGGGVCVSFAFHHHTSPVLSGFSHSPIFLEVMVAEETALISHCGSGPFWGEQLGCDWLGSRLVWPCLAGLAG